MAFGNPFTGVGNALLEGLLPRLAQRRDEQRAIEALNPVRESLLNQLTGQQPFAGGPASEFPPGTPGVQQSPFAEMLGGQQAPQGAQAPGPQPQQAAQPQDELSKLPEDLRPPPRIDAALRRAADAHGVPVNALRALAAQESNFRANVVGGTPIDLPGQVGDRARGLFQFTPAEIAKMPGFDPNDPMQAADETARRLKAAMDQGKPIDIAMMEHFGGPDPRYHKEKTRKYHSEVTEKFQRLEEASAGGGGQARQGGRGVLGQGESVGPFGTIIQDEKPRLSRAQEMLAAVAKDPRAFAQQFAGEGGMERIQKLLEGGGTGAQQTRVISGDTPEGRAMGIQPGERARVAGTVMPSGQFFPQEVKATPFGADAEGGGGPLVTLMDMESGEVTSRRRDDPEVDEMISSGRHVIANDGRAMESLERMSSSERRAMNESAIGARTYIATVGDAIGMLNDNPDINTFVSRGAALINDIRTEAKAFAGAMGAEFDENIFDVGAHEGTFRELGVENVRMKSLITSLAFQRAVAEKGGSSRITNRDIERFIAEIGGSTSHAPTLAQVLQDTAERAARAHRIRFEETTKAPFEGDLGLSNLPRFAPREQFNNGEGGGMERTPAPMGVPDDLMQAVPQGFMPGKMLPDGRLEVLDESGNIVGHVEQ